MPPRDPGARKGEIAKAGRLFFDAVFGEPGAFERTVRDELTADEPRESAPVHAAIEPATTRAGAPTGAPALPPSLMRCGDCGREQAIPASFGARDLERLGWRRVDRAWRCSFCTE